MTRGELVNMLERIARETHLTMMDSVKRNRHMNLVDENCPDVPQYIVDAILVSFINEVGTQQGLDYGLYTHYLYDEK